MQVNVLKTESKLMGRNMLRIHEWESADEIANAEADIIARYNPAYIYLAVEATDLRSIQKLEAIGYSFSEFRIRTRLNTSNNDISTRSFFPFKLEMIGEEDLFEKAVAILMTSLDDDRFSNDPLIGHQFSKDRLVANLRKSFTTYPKEFLLGLFNSNTDAMIAFRSGAFISNTEAIYYQFGIAEGHDHDHVANMLEAFTIEFLKKRGIEIIHAVSTGFNIAVLNNLIKKNDFVIASSSVLMRKVFD